MGLCETRRQVIVRVVVMVRYGEDGDGGNCWSDKAQGRWW